MGLPEINIEFIGKANTAIKRSERGIVAIIVKDTIARATSYVFDGVESIPNTEFKAANLDFFNQALQGCSKILVEVMPTGSGTSVADVLRRLKIKKFNYLVYPEATTEEITSIVAWVKECRNTFKKTFKTVIQSTAAPDHEGVVNFDTDVIALKNGTSYARGQLFTPRIAGILAGLPFTRSATYFVLNELESIKEVDNPNTVIDAGKLILINDGEKIKIASGVNSLTTVGNGGKTVDMQDILIIEKMDLLKDDIVSVYENEYVGKVINTYNNKQLFVSSVHSYFDALIKDFQFFDTTEENRIEVDIQANKKYLESVQVDTANMDEQQIKSANTGKKLFLKGKVKLTNTMQDLDLALHM